MGLNERYKKFRENHDVKSLKLFLLIFILFFGTLIIYFKKRDEVTYKITRYVKAKLPPHNTYKMKQIVLIDVLDSNQNELAKQVVGERALKGSLKKLKLVYNKFTDRGDTYVVTLFLNRQNSIVWMNKPVKQ